MIEQFELTMTSLNRKRIVRVYLPENYNPMNEITYPVLYMHDGQNLFNDADASYGTSWGIASYLDKSDIELIVVGIDSNSEGFKRLDEYSPWKSSSLSNLSEIRLSELGGEGKEYIDFIVHELKPMIDQKYKTNPEASSMAGSSMGGLISTYAACVYPNVFKKIASVSSAYWFNQKEIEDLIIQSDFSSIDKFYLDVGTHESENSDKSKRYIESSNNIYNLLKEKIKDCKIEIINDAVHNERAWKERVPSIFSFLFI